MDAAECHLWPGVEVSEVLHEWLCFHNVISVNFGAEVLHDLLALVEGELPVDRLEEVLGGVLPQQPQHVPDPRDALQLLERVQVLEGEDAGLLSLHLDLVGEVLPRSLILFSHSLSQELSQVPHSPAEFSVQVLKQLDLPDGVPHLLELGDVRFLDLRQPELEGHSPEWSLRPLGVQQDPPELLVR